MRTGINEEEEALVCLLYPLHCTALHCIALRVAAMILNIVLQIVTAANIKIQSVNEKMDADLTDKLLFVYTVVGCKACLEQMYRADKIAEMTSRRVFQITNRAVKSSGHCIQNKAQDRQCNAVLE